MSGGKLPEGWVVTNLQNIANWGSGGTPSRSHDEYYNGNIPWVKTGDLGPKLITEASEYITDAGVKNSSAKYFPKGSVAIAMYGATIGKTSILGIDATTNQACAVGSPIEGITSSIFLYYFLLNEKNAFIKKGKGGAQPNISQAVIKEHPLSLPPYAEQKIIAEKLDTLLAQVDSTKARLEQIPQILKRFRQAVMKLAITGELTSEYRNNFPTNLVQEIAGIVEKERIEKKIKNSKLSKEPYPAKIPFSIPKSWQWYRLGHISLKITDGAHNTPKVLSEGYPYIMAKDLTKGKLDFSEERFISEKDHKELYFKCAPEVGDLLVVNIGAGTGNNVLIDSDIEFSFKNIAIIKKSKLITPTYLKIFFDSQKNRIFNEQTKGGAQPFLSLSVLNDIPFALPPLPEQHEIVRRVEQLFAYADTIEKQVNNALTRVNSLTQSILAKAFRGELTAQWRADNPSLISGENSAAALLERIKAERAASSGKKNSRKKA